MASHEQPKKDWTLRIQRIPVGTNEDGLKKNLATLGDASSLLREAFMDAKLCSLVVSERKFRSATVIVTTAAPLDELLREFNQSCKKADFGYLLDNSFYGITPLSEDQEGTTCDIVAISGLDSHALGSWKTRNENDVWLRDWLPTDISKIRILLYGYDSKLLNSTSRSSLETLSQNFLDSLIAFRRDTDTVARPIIFLGCSLGGLLVKEALVQSLRAPSSKPYKKQLHLACRGMVFFGVPHWGIQNDCLQTIVQDQPNKHLINSIVVDNDTEASPHLKRLSKDFAECFDGETRVISVFETHKSKTLIEVPDKTLKLEGEHKYLVTELSATHIGLTGRLHQETVPFDTDHYGLTKFESNADPRYYITKGHISDLVVEATRRPVQSSPVQMLEPAGTTSSQHGPSHITMKGPNFNGHNRIEGGSSVNQGNNHNQSLSFNFG